MDIFGPVLPAPSVIVRTHNSARTVGQLLDDLAAQTVAHELIVVDSGSTDGTLALVGRRCDRLVELPAAEYRPGRALNVGTAAAAGAIVFAVSSHCRLPRAEWIERASALYADPRVAGTNGATRDRFGAPLHGVHLQVAADVRANPYWGFSNHAASWRRSVWAEHGFSESLPTAEDKEWALRVLEAGWSLAYHPALEVAMDHRWRQGTVHFLRRERTEAIALGSFLELSPYGVRELAAEWWRPPNPRHALTRERLNPRRIAGLVGRYLGHRAVARTHPPARG